MRNRNRYLFAGGMLAGAVALGCQAPTPNQGGMRAPRVVHQVGSLQLTPDTDLALQLQQPCADGKPAYALKALDARIDEIDVTIVGPTHPAPGYVKTVTRADFADGCSMNELFENLFPGQYTVSMKGYKLNATPGGPRIPTMQSEATQTITVGTDAIETVVLKCDFSTGAVRVEINCCSPAPATPTPTATPVPTPTPPAELDASHIGGTTGFSVDDLGRLYVFGFDPGKTATTFQNPGFTGNEGRVVRITGPQVEATWIDGTPAISEGEFQVTTTNGAISGRKFVAMGVNYSFDGVNCVMNLDLDTPAQTVKMQRTDVGQNVPNTGNTLDGAGNLLFTRTFLGHAPNIEAYDIRRVAGPNFATGANDSVQLSAIDPSTGGWYGGYKPFSLSWDGDAATPTVVFATGNGVVRTVGPNNNSLPQIEVAGPAYGLILAGGTSPGYFFTRGNQNSHSVHYAPVRGTAATPSTATVACTFTYGYPWRIERGLDGFVYVMLMAESAPTGDANELHQYRIVKARQNADNTLTPLAVVANKFVSAAPASFTPPTP